MKITRRHIGPAERARILARSYHCCVECGEPEREAVYIVEQFKTIEQPAVRLEIDHIIPLAAGGADVEGNLQALCGGPGRCHSKKTVRDMGVIAKTRRLYQKHNRTAVKKVRKWKHKLQSRGFRKDVRRRFDGTVELRAEMEKRHARDKKFMTGKHW